MVGTVASVSILGGCGGLIKVASLLAIIESEVPKISRYTVPSQFDIKKTDFEAHTMYLVPWTWFTWALKLLVKEWKRVERWPWNACKSTLGHAFQLWLDFSLDNLSNQYFLWLTIKVADHWNACVQFVFCGGYKRLNNKHKSYTDCLPHEWFDG